MQIKLFNYIISKNNFVVKKMGCTSSIKEMKKKSFICTYEIKDNEEIQIINNGFGNYILNKEIGTKIKILNCGAEEQLVFKKKFDYIGTNTVSFFIEDNLEDMSFMFNACSCFKKSNF